jgi:hypothetical protein
MGLITSKTLSNGLTGTRQYDALRRLPKEAQRINEREKEISKEQLLGMIPGGNTTFSVGADAALVYGGVKGLQESGASKAESVQAEAAEAGPERINLASPKRTNLY